MSGVLDATRQDCVDVVGVSDATRDGCVAVVGVSDALRCGCVAVVCVPDAKRYVVLLWSACLMLLSMLCCCGRCV